MTRFDILFFLNWCTIVNRKKKFGIIEYRFFSLLINLFAIFWYFLKKQGKQQQVNQVK